jgi:sulfhydrogenase subunit beta (sulfur reductase)
LLLQHACDIHALKILDLLYMSDFVDPYYKRNREQLTVVGYGCFPDEKCFCRSQGTANVDDGFDLFLTPLEGRFLVTIASARGDDIVRANHDLFEPSTRSDVQ